MASLVKTCRHPRSQWNACRCAWYLRSRSGGKDSYTNVGKDRDAAELALARHRDAADETVAQALDVWIAARGRAPGARAGTLTALKTRSKQVRAVLGGLPVRSVRPGHLAAFAQSLLVEGYAPTTVRGMYFCLTGTLRHAMRRGVIAAMPLPPDGPGIPTQHRGRHTLTLVEVKGVIERMEGKWALLAELILLTGLRFGEAVAIERGDIQGNVLVVQRTRTRRGATNPPKTRAGIRAVPLSPRAAEILNTLPLPFPGAYKQGHTALVKAMGELHQDGMGFHVLRNAHASAMEAAGISLRDQAARMGHGHDWAVTVGYGLATGAGDASAIDEVMQRASPSAAPSEGGGQVDELAARRARRR